jgi:hypothetical protein
MMNPTQLLLIERGIEHAERGHFRQISTKKICAEVGKSHTLVFHYFDSARAFHKVSPSDTRPRSVRRVRFGVQP